ncbi:MAG TPA: P-II family nitrogen regulator [Myxococcota bacterium]|nr:P-II family nitrogen regulator [Myxococcota bacterium]
MRKLEFVLQPESLGDVSNALARAKFGAFRASDVTIFDPAAPQGRYRGTEYTVGRELVKVELVVPDQEVEQALEALRVAFASSRSGTEVQIVPIFDSVQIRPASDARRRERF